MCEDKIMKMKRDIRLARRRARRLRTVHDLMARPIHDLMARPIRPAPLDLASSDSESYSERFSPKPLQRLTPHESMACLRNVAARTVVLMQRNEEIQRRVLELKRETAAFLDAVMSDPQNQMRFPQYFGAPTPFQTPPASESETDDSEDDLRSLPDTEDTDANDSYDVEMKADVTRKREPKY